MPHKEDLLISLSKQLWSHCEQGSLQIRPAPPGCLVYFKLFSLLFYEPSKSISFCGSCKKKRKSLVIYTPLCSWLLISRAVDFFLSNQITADFRAHSLRDVITGKTGETVVSSIFSDTLTQTISGWWGQFT